jgi:hypothetical protein
MDFTLPTNIEQFNIKEVIIAGDECILVTPKDMGVDWDDQNKYFRSSIWRKSDMHPISLGFKKFMNLGEKPSFEPIDDYTDLEFIRKMDGCCDENTILYTEYGTKTIKEVCESEFAGKVKGFCHDRKEEIWVDVLAHSIKTNLNNWYELELEDGKKIKLTGNHKVWLPELNCYRAVEDLKENEVFLLKK